ncbi:hypothetical protein [Acidithiobacillus sp.]
MNPNSHIPNRLPRMLLAFCALGVMPLSAAADHASGYLQPPILGWHTLPKAAQPVAPVASVAPRPVSTPPAPLPAPPPEAVVPPVIHTVTAVKTSPLQPSAPAVQRQNPVQRLLAFQSEARDPGTFQPILGVEAERSFKNYLKSFTDNSGSASSSSATGAGNDATLQGMRSAQTGGNASGY